MTPSDFAEFFLVEGLWIDRRIPNWQVPIGGESGGFQIPGLNCTK